MNMRQFSRLDEAIMHLDNVLSGFSNMRPPNAKREYPAESLRDSDLSSNEKKHASGLMRVNHAGEIAAQALYKAQSVLVKDDELKKTMQQSADQEFDHLDWCERRLEELGEDVSYLTPVWYLGSFGIGIVEGSFGDKWNLGFIAETEHQVVSHLETHIKELPLGDNRSRAILEQMQADEQHHADEAETSGAKKLPLGVKKLMRFASKIMTKTAYHI